ncbi:MAG: AMP-binding protein [Chloroflexi bacterium]|nr:AMP-binding protein [Chloroflexota bacterium]
MSTPTTFTELLALGSDEAIALTAPGRLPLTYHALRQHVQQTIATLNGYGIGRNDRVAIVLPNGPEMASAFVSVAAGATAAPLNPAYQQNEYAFYMEDLHAKALLVEQGSASPAVAAAQELGIPLLELIVADNDPAGRFSLTSSLPAVSAASGGPAGSEDVALILHTSGTTSRPKIVPLLQRNVCASVGNIRDTLALTPADHCLNVMPLFHIHGLMAALLSSLLAGASVCCTPGFNALQFFAWLDGEKPTWYTAVPTMHQAILSRAARNQEIIDAANLRFVRSSSASLPPQVMGELEATFRAPVIEAYGMTEASHQMTSNPLPPRPRKVGTVGIAIGLDVAIMDKEGNLLPPNTTGEIVIRGRNVTPGYENNPQANAENFTNGWFRTGDQGIQDEDGYLTITGRLKEIINRGGEKISPREVDEVLMDHPAVQQAVTFAMPHPKLGEEVAAAVVLRDGAEATERDIRDFAAERLAPFKVPRKVLILTEIPKGPTGKLQRIGLAEKLGLG